MFGPEPCLELNYAVSVIIIIIMCTYLHVHVHVYTRHNVATFHRVHRVRCGDLESL